ncbi:MAG: MBL fold metallo-hydrolase [Dehalococcoidia bacterium]|jgi:glyoxylase-like metal-dependent hydrolase (beta-lactamase superfamily II)
MPQARFRLGNLELLVMSDGSYFLDAGAVFGVVPRERWEPYAGPMDSHHRLGVGTNCLALRSQGKAILIETGVGDKAMRADATPLVEGNLLDELKAGFGGPEDVDVVINSHLHGDHCGWNTRYVDGKLAPTFPNADYLVQRAEWEAATHPNERTHTTYLAENLQPVADSGRLRLLDGETRLTDDVTIIPTPGHSPGHASVVITSGGEMAIYVGDMVQQAVQLERTAWVSAFDVLPLISMESKKRLVEQAITDNALLICVHLQFPGVGRMTRSADGYKKWQPVT